MSAQTNANFPHENTGWGMRPRLDATTLTRIHAEQGCNDFGPGEVCSVCRPACTCTGAEQVGKPFGWHKGSCPRSGERS